MLEDVRQKKIAEFVTMEKVGGRQLRHSLAEHFYFQDRRLATATGRRNSSDFIATLD